MFRHSGLALLLALTTCGYACAASRTSSTAAGTSGEGGAAGGTTVASTTVGTGGMKDDLEDGGLVISDAASEDPVIEPDAACAATTEMATATVLPVDIIWIVDNSASMASAITEIKQGLNTFASLIAAKNLDYRVIMLSLRGAQSPVMIGGSARYPVCIPPPLAGDANCGDGPLFFQSSIDIRSTQPFEQFLGTLGQTKGYTAADAKGGPPWALHLRPEATKSIVVVTDDNARLSATDFETFIGGKNPFNSLELPPGILDPVWNGLFDGYFFDGIYGWGNENDPSVVCSFPDQSQPANAGATYTTLVKKTGGVRAKICDGAAAWLPFFNAVAQAVISTSKLSCELSIPTPSMGSIDPDKINVAIESGNGQAIIPGVESAMDCGAAGGWYYDDPVQPTKVILCPASCDAAQAAVGPGKDGHIDVLFGCEKIVP
ncbi:MAG: hypothetical protein ABI193_19650 [Minicystis sp.]